MRRWLGLGFVFFACLFITRAWSQDFEEFMDKFLLENPTENLNPLFQQGLAVQHRSPRRERAAVLGFEPTLDVNFGPYANLGTGLLFGYSFSEHFEVDLLWVPFFWGIKKATASQLADLQFTSGGAAPNLTQSQKKNEYTALVHWTPGYGKISFSSERAYRYDFFLDAILGYVTFQNTSSPKAGLGFGDTLYFSDHFGLRYTLSGSLLNTPNLKTGDAGVGLTGEFDLGTVFYL